MEEGVSEGKKERRETKEKRERGMTAVGFPSFPFFPSFPSLSVSYCPADDAGGGDSVMSTRKRPLLISSSLALT